MVTFLLKQDSTQGRAFILSRSLFIIRQNPSGIGAERFHIAFATAQREYFKTHDLNDKTALLAGDNYFAFNEYIHITAERGIAAGIAFLLFVIGSVIFGIKKFRTRPEILPSLLCFFAISVASLFFYLLHNWFMLALFGITALGIYGLTFLKNRAYWVFLCVSAGFVGLFLMQGFRHEEKLKQQLRDAEHASFSGYPAIADSLFRMIPKSDQHCPDYLLACTVHWMNKGQYDSALVFASRAATVNASHRLFLMLGDIYFKLGKNAEAENAYKNATYTIPSKFISRKKLADFYHATGNKHAEKIWLQSILELPAKIPSREVDAIKSEANTRQSAL